MTIAETIPHISEAQRKMAALIERILSAKGVPPEIIAGAIVNAKAESGLNPRAIGDNGASVGLFQLHRKGAGKGMSVAERQDPTKNTLRIYEEFERYGGPLRRAYKAGDRSIATMAALWSTHIERPKDKAGEAAKRASMAKLMFPTTLPQVAKRVATGWVIGTLVSGAVLAGLIYHHRKRQQAPMALAASA